MTGRLLQSNVGGMGMRLKNIILVVFMAIMPLSAIADSQLCASAVKETGDRNLAGDYRKFRDSCSAYQQCVDKVLKADNVYMSCRSKCGSVSGGQQKSCLKTCLSKTSSKTDETSKRVKESCGSLKTNGACEAARKSFQASLKKKGEPGKKVDAACSMMFGSL